MLIKIINQLAIITRISQNINSKMSNFKSIQTGVYGFEIKAHSLVGKQKSIANFNFSDNKRVGETTVKIRKISGGEEFFGV